MTNPLEQLKSVELKANFTPRERKYFYKLRDELEAIVGGVSIETLNKPTDVVQARKIRAKLEEILRFVQDRKIELDLDDEEFIDELVSWLKVAHIDSITFEDDDYWKEWIGNNIQLENNRIIITTRVFDCRDTLKFLPDNLVFTGTLNLGYCKKLNKLPSGLVVKGELDLRHCKTLTALPDDLLVDGDITVYGLSRSIINKAHLLKERRQIGGEVFDSDY